MPRCRLRQLGLLWLVLAGLAACTPNQPPALPAPTAAPRAATVALPSVLAEPQRWSGQRFTLIAPLIVRGDDRILMMQPDAPPSPGNPSAIWLATPLADAVQQQLKQGVGILKLRGELSPPGAYGREQQYPYQFTATSVEILTPERTTLANLALNPTALNGVVLTIEGTLLAQNTSALLVENVSAGGVPTVGAAQIKLARSTVDSVIAKLPQRSGDVRWGRVRIIGWWQGGTLTPFVAEVLPQS